MSYIKRAFEDEIYSRTPINAFNWLVGNGWSEDEAKEVIDMFYGEL